MRRNVLLSISMLLMAILLFGCTIITTVSEGSSKIQKFSTINTVTDANNQFALDLYRELSKEGGNVFFSPWSISSAFAIMLEGARGETYDEISATFYLNKDEMVRRSSYYDLYSNLSDNPEYELHTANALWLEKTFQPVSSYAETIQQYYGGDLKQADFIGNPDGERIAINKWVEERTKEKIKGLLPAGSVDVSTGLVVTNAVYFKADWVKQFNKNLTTEQEFYVSPENVKKVPMMHRNDRKGNFPYTETENVQVLELPYKGEKLSMLVFLPKGDNLSDVEQNLSIEQLSRWRSGLHEELVQISIPKFKLESKYRLSEPLKVLGIQSAFTRDADFSGIDIQGSLFISEAFHKAFVDVNEEGTEAAAATGIVSEFTGAQPYYRFKADHPFIFLIQDKATGTILFIGKVMDPT